MKKHKKDYMHRLQQYAILSHNTNVVLYLLEGVENNILYFLNAIIPLSLLINVFRNMALSFSEEMKYKASFSGEILLVLIFSVKIEKNNICYTKQFDSNGLTRKDKKKHGDMDEILKKLKKKVWNLPILKSKKSKKKKISRLVFFLLEFEKWSTLPRSSKNGKGPEVSRHPGYIHLFGMSYQKMQMVAFAST